MAQRLDRITAEAVADPNARRARRVGAVPHPTRAERVARGRAIRAEVPLESQALVIPDDLRADPIGLLERQAESRVPDLVPIRYGRMLQSPFTFYRGAALIMASDLAGSASSGLRVQLCGDAHMSNFGVFASAERNLVFDVNDFDETLPGPFEWDVKRLAASVEIAGRNNGFKRKQRRQVVLGAVAAYREGMREFARQPNLAVWYARVDVDRDLPAVRSALKPSRARRVDEVIARARTRDSLQAFAKLTTVVDGLPRIISDPPLVVPMTELLPEQDASALLEQLRVILRSYRRTLQSDRKHLLEQFHLVDMARKVVGVGSVGTRAWILLMQGVDGQDPLFLQAKEAQASVLEAYAGASTYANHGARVVAGQHLMQASSDIFLGWQRTSGVDGVSRDYYIRQLRDWKGSFPPEEMIPSGMSLYARLCALTLARAHARSGDRVAIAAYLGNKPTFEEAIADFAEAYAEVNDRDYNALATAAGSGAIAVERGV
jgi:uncharacterized protein (DUF2252 family)